MMHSTQVCTDSASALAFHQLWVFARCDDALHTSVSCAVISARFQAVEGVWLVVLCFTPVCTVAASALAFDRGRCVWAGGGG